MVAAIANLNDYRLSRAPDLDADILGWIGPGRNNEWLSAASDIVSVSYTSAALRDGEQDVADKFEALCQRWMDATSHLSIVQDIILHPAYQQIIGLGMAAVPLILRKVEEEMGHWSWALHAITCDDPVPAEDAGNMRKMQEAWLRWAAERGWR